MYSSSTAVSDLPVTVTTDFPLHFQLKKPKLDPQVRHRLLFSSQLPSASWEFLASVSDLWCSVSTFQRRSRPMSPTSQSQSAGLTSSNVRQFKIHYEGRTNQSTATQMFLRPRHLCLFQTGLTSLWMTRQPIKCCGSQRAALKLLAWLTVSLVLFWIDRKDMNMCHRYSLNTHYHTHLHQTSAAHFSWAITSKKKKVVTHSLNASPSVSPKISQQPGYWTVVDC